MHALRVPLLSVAVFVLIVALYLCLPAIVPASGAEVFHFGPASGHYNPVLQHPALARMHAKRCDSCEVYRLPPVNESQPLPPAVTYEPKPVETPDPRSFPLLILAGCAVAFVSAVAFKWQQAKSAIG